MKWIRGLLTALSLSMGIALLLSLFVRIPGDLAVDRPVTGAFSRPLTDRELVNGLKELHLQLKLQKVDWSFSTLSIDLELPRLNIPKEDIFHDLYLLSQFGFVRFNNVDQMFLRVYDYSPASSPDDGKTKGPLLVAMSAKGRSEAREALLTVPDPSVPVELIIRSHFHLTFTPQWTQKYQDSAVH